MTEAQVPPFREQHVGEIAASLPGATAVFRRFKLDFCCGGAALLSDAAAARNVDVAAIEEELEAVAARRGKPDAPAETDALIDHIVNRYHQAHRMELPELLNLASKVEAVHAQHAEAPAGLAELLRDMIGELEVHMKKEELILFPAMRRSDRAMAADAVWQMRAEHDDHAEHLRKLEFITNDLTLPEDACRSWQALYSGVGKFVDDLTEHIHLENNILFPRFEDE